jgi:hypothetical protein
MDVSRIGRNPVPPDLLFEAWCLTGGLRHPKTLADLVGEFVYASMARSQITSLQAVGRQDELIPPDERTADVQPIDSARIRKLVIERDGAVHSVMRRVDAHAGAVYRTLMRGHVPRAVYEGAREVVGNPEADVMGFCLALEMATETAGRSYLKRVVEKPSFTSQTRLVISTLSYSFSAAGGELAFDRPDIGLLPTLDIAI